MKDPVNNDSWEEPGSGTPGSTRPTLLDGVRAGDEECRERLVALYLPLVFHRYLARVSKDERADVAQSVFVTVFRKIDGFEKRFDGPAFRGWLYQIAYHKVGDYIRRKQRECRSTGGVDLPGPIQPCDDATVAPEATEPVDERHLLVRRVLELARAEFEPDTYAAAWQLLIERRPADQVAAALGKTRNAVYIAKSRVLGRVRRILEELGEWGEG